MDNIKVSVITVCKNSAKTIEETIQSVIYQTYSNIEIIISDNHSMDCTEEIIQDLLRERNNIRFFKHEKNIGMVGNWNFCLEQAGGKFFLMLSDDDLLEKTAIEKMVNCMNDEKDLK